MVDVGSAVDLHRQGTQTVGEGGNQRLERHKFNIAINKVAILRISRCLSKIHFKFLVHAH